MSLHGIQRHLARIRELAHSQARHIADAVRTIHQLERTMAQTAQDLNTEIDALAAALAAHEQARNDADVALQSTIDSLKAEIAGGAAVDFQPFIDRLETIRQSIAVPAPTPPAAPVVDPAADPAPQS